MLKDCDVHAQAKEQKPEGYLREGGHIIRDYRVSPTKPTSWMLDRRLTPPPLDCSGNHKDDRCKNEQAE
jgi:hypothetical protein